MKKVVSLLTILCLLCGVPIGAFAENAENPSLGRSKFNPMPFGEELKLSNVKTVDGEWKSVTVKLSEAKLDNAGALAVNKEYEFVNVEELKKSDFAKVKLTCTMQGYSGKDGYIAKNMPVTILGTGEMNSIHGDIHTSVSNFTGAFMSLMNKYKVGKKEIDGAWSYKKVSQLNPSKQITVSGYAFVSVRKGQINNTCIWLSIHEKNSEYNNDLYLALNKYALNSTLVNKKGDYTYGDEKNGIIKSNFELKKDNDEPEPGYNIYCLGEQGAKYFYVYSKASVYGVDVNSIEEALESLKEYSKIMSVPYTKISSNVFSVKGLNPDDGKYVSCYFIDKGSYGINLVMVSSYREKAAQDKLWENYKIANKVDASVIAAQATSETKPPEINNTYGNDKVGKFTVPMTLQKFVEKGNENGTLDSDLIQFTEGEETHWIVGMSVHKADKETKLDDYANYYINHFNKVSELKNKKELIKYENMVLLIMNEISKNNESWMCLLIEKNDKLYYFATETYDPAYKEVQSTAIKSYLLDKGFTEEAVKTILLDPVFQ